MFSKYGKHEGLPLRKEPTPSRSDGAQKCSGDAPWSHASDTGTGNQSNDFRRYCLIRGVLCILKETEIT